MRVFLSLPMTGKTEEEVSNTIEEMKKFATEQLGIQDAVFVYNYNYIPDINKNDYFAIGDRAEILNRVGHAIQEIGTCNLVIFYKEWYTARGCEIERQVCRTYSIPCIDIPEDEPNRFSIGTTSELCEK